MPTVSVIIPTHNRASLLAVAVQSVLAQTFQDFEILIVDDASTDNTKEVVSALSDNRIRYFRRDMSGGDAVARNLGIANSKGEYIAFLDDDDSWLPEKLDLQMNLFKISTFPIGGVHAGYMKIDLKSQKIVGLKFAEERGDIFNSILGENLINTSSVVIKKECIEEVGVFDESIPWCSDQDLWIRISEKYHWDCVKEALVKYGEHQVKLTKNFKLKIAGKERIIKKHSKWLRLNPKAFCVHYHALGIIWCLIGDIGKGRSAFYKVLAVSPLNAKTICYCALSFLGSNLFRNVVDYRNNMEMSRWLRGGQ